MDCEVHCNLKDKWKIIRKIIQESLSRTKYRGLHYKIVVTEFRTFNLVTDRVLPSNFCSLF